LVIGLLVVMLKASDFRDISSLVCALMIYAVAIISLAVWRYRKVA
jgi:hypothetical protein